MDCSDSDSKPSYNRDKHRRRRRKQNRSRSDPVTPNRSKSRSESKFTEKASTSIGIARARAFHFDLDDSSQSERGLDEESEFDWKTSDDEIETSLFDTEPDINLNNSIESECHVQAAEASSNVDHNGNITECEQDINENITESGLDINGNFREIEPVSFPFPLSESELLSPSDPFVRIEEFDEEQAEASVIFGHPSDSQEQSSSEEEVGDENCSTDKTNKFPFNKLAQQIYVESDTEAEFEYILRDSAHEMQTRLEAMKPTLSCTQLFNSSKPQILETIVSWLNWETLLAARKVCKLWNQSISNSTGFWGKIRLFKVKELRVNWTEIIKSDLVNQFSCPNYHFYRCNFLDIEGNLFIIKKARQLKHLTLTKCTFSLSTLQVMLAECCCLEHLEIRGLPRCVSYSEAVFPIRPLKKRFRLQTLILQAKKLKAGHHQLDPWHNCATHLNLHKDFIMDLIQHSTALQKVELTGWGSRTCFNVITNFFVSNRQHSDLEELRFLDIPLDSFTFDDFYPVATKSLKLRKFSLTLRKPLPREDPVFYNHQAFANLILNEVIKLNRMTLEEVVLDNVPLNPAVFSHFLPRLKRISIVGTGIQLTEAQVKEYMLGLKNVSENCDSVVGLLNRQPDEETKGDETMGFTFEPFDEDIDVGFSFSVTCGKLLMIIFSLICLYFVCSQSSEHVGIVIFLFSVVSIMTLCANNAPTRTPS